MARKRDNEGALCEANKSQQFNSSMMSIDDGKNGNYSNTSVDSRMRKMDISISDNAELRKALIDRCENIVIKITEELCAGILPSISQKMTNINTLMEQIESNDSAVDDEYREMFDSPVSFDVDGPLDDLENLESLGYESLESEMTLDHDPGTNESQERKTSIVKFSSRNSQGKFALIIKTMAKVHGLLINNRTQTRRSFFYELKSSEDMSALTIHQRQIDRIVNNLANILDCGPSDVGLIGTAKGLGAGELILTLANDEIIDYGTSSGGVLIPQIISNVTSIRTRAERVIVVEKDAVFQKLLKEDTFPSLNCILITGKGYPDVATRMLVKILGEKLQLPVYILVDADPYGIEIMFTYKYGSMNLSYEEGNNLACPSARWIGVHPSEFESLNIPIIALTDTEVTKLEAIKSRPYVTRQMNRQLTIMRRQGKAEIEAIKSGPYEHDELTTFYLSRKILNADYI